MSYLQALDDDGKPGIAKMMDHWTNQIGYPVITINTTNGEIYQKHFLFNDSSESRFVVKTQQILYSSLPIKLKKKKHLHFLHFFSSFSTPSVWVQQTAIMLVIIK